MHSEAENKVLEDIGSDGIGTGLEVELVDTNDGSIKAPFDPAEIDVITQARTVDLLLTRLNEGEMDLSPDFQRRGNLWTDKRKSGLIESMLLRIPIPSLYVSEDKEGNYTVVDGLQRMCAIAHFVRVDALNKAVESSLSPLRLSGLQSLPPEFQGKAFGDLPRPLKRRINETELTLHIIRASTPQAVKFNIFSRINQGGLPLAPQEIRNAIYGGDWRKHAKLLAENAEFLAATEFKIKGERMEDVELVLRFAAHFSMDPDDTRPDSQNLDDFLNNFVQSEASKWATKDWVRISEAFEKAMIYSREIFGRYAFRKFYGEQYNRSPINRGLFESEAVVLARLPNDRLIEIAQKREEVLSGLASLCSGDHDFISSLLYATGRGSSSNIRLQKLTHMLASV